MEKYEGVFRSGRKRETLYGPDVKEAVEIFFSDTEEAREYREMAERLNLHDIDYLKALITDISNPDRKDNIQHNPSRSNEEMAKKKEVEVSEDSFTELKKGKKVAAKGKIKPKGKAKTKEFKLKGAFTITSEGVVTKQSKSIVKVSRGRGDNSNQYIITMIVTKR